MKKPTMVELFEILNKIPDGFVDGCKSYADTVPIYYKRHKRYAECICGKCGKIFITSDRAYRGEKAKCMHCGTEGEYEWRKCTRTKCSYYTVVLVQRTKDNNIVLRHFACENRYQQGDPQFFVMNEYCRQFMQMGDFYKFNRSYNVGLRGETFRSPWGTRNAGTIYADYIYPGWDAEIAESNLKYFKKGELGFVAEIKAYSRNPAIEMFRKMGLTQLANELVCEGGRNRHINRRGKTVKQQLRLKDRRRINFLRDNKGGILLLSILQFEEKNGIRLSDRQRTWLESTFRQWDGEKKVRYMTRFMSLQQLMNRTERYVKQKDYREYEILNAYYDYLRMRQELGYDMTNEVFIFPKSLKEKHDEMVEEKNRTENEKYAAEQEKKYGGIREKFGTLQKKYGYADGDLLIRPAESATEIITEGRTLHHCVGRLDYMEKHCEGRSYILFLRKAAEPEKPYYTIEIREDEIIQWYGAHDKKPDEEIVGRWLNGYIRHLGGTKAVYAC